MPILLCAQRDSSLLKKIAFHASIRFRHVSELRRIFDEAGIEWHRPVVTTCGTGVTASILALGLNIVKPDLPVGPVIVALASRM